jgi:folate-binding protein YgfZ
VSGEDRVRWLNGMVTNNTRDLPQDFGNYNFVLDARGHIQADLSAFQRGDFYMLESEIEQIPKLRELFDRFIIMDDVEVGDVSSDLTSIGIAGPRADEVLRSTGLLAAELRPGQLGDGNLRSRGYTLVRDPVAVRNWYEIWLSPQYAEEFWRVLLSAGASQVGAEALDWQRILLGLPKMGVDTGARELPQETGQEYALHAAKGCYIGQEIVERVRSRGQVHRRLSGLVLEGPLPEHGSKVMSGDKEVGEVTSSAEIVADGIARKLALGYIRRNLLEQGETVQVDGSPAQLTELPFRF